MLDDIDRKLVELLQADAKLSNAELAQAVGLTPSPTFERVKKLEQRGVITGYGARVDPAKLGKSLLAFSRLSFDHQPNMRESLARLGELCRSESGILECHDVAGEDCVILKLRCRDTAELQRLLGAVKDRVPIARSVTNIVLETMKESSAVFPGEAGGPEAPADADT
jgi:Lrp/AsnC family transcriptional regulator, leucine-responsive regulatory protein